MIDHLRRLHLAVMRRCPWPWHRQITCAIIWSAIAGATVGSLTAWWYGRPWLEFNGMAAYYIDGEDRVHVAGNYSVNSVCRPPAVWRIDAVSPTGPVLTYGPPWRQSMIEGDHFFQDELPIPAGARPEGWKITLLATCATTSHQQTVASQEFPVMVIDGPVPNDRRH